MSRRSVAFLVVLVLLFAGCSSKPKQELRRYELDGRIVAVDAPAKKLTISHRDIPGFMKAMTMEFKVKDTWVLDKAKPGDQVGAILVMDPEGAYLENISLTSNAADPGANTSPVHNPELGEQVPDFTLTNQHGKRIKLSGYRGRPVLLTFIYTRCPLPDYCIRMSSNFAEIEKRLNEATAKPAGLELISISIDPEFDTPAVLRQYSESYKAKQYSNWQFVTGKPEEVQKVADFFGLSYVKQDKQIVHSLRTALLDGSGKIVAVYRGNDWKPEDVITELKRMQ